MKKLKIIFSVILLAVIGTNCFFGCKYFKLKNNIEETNNRISIVTKSIEDKKAQLSTLNEEYELYRVEDSDLVEEYENWKRQNQKLEDILY